MRSEPPQAVSKRDAGLQRESASTVRTLSTVPSSHSGRRKSNQRPDYTAVSQREKQQPAVLSSETNLASVTAAAIKTNTLTANNNQDHQPGVQQERKEKDGGGGGGGEVAGLRWCLSHCGIDAP